MSNLKLPTLTYSNLSRLLPSRSAVRTLAYATTAERFPASNGASWDTFLIRHHGNPIAEIGPDYFTIDNAGWNSTTTANRLNRIVKDNGAPYGVAIRQYTMVILSSDLKILRGMEIPAHFSRVSPEAEYALHS